MEWKIETRGKRHASGFLEACPLRSDRKLYFTFKKMMANV
jgi:hypothetical protein